MSKKIPMRQCVGCGEMKSKKELLRVIRTAEDEILLDATGRKNGRVTMALTLAPFKPTQAPTGSTSGSLLHTAIFVLLPASLEMLLISTMPSFTSVTSDSKRRFTNSGWVLDTRIFGPLEVDFTSRI